MGVGALLKRSSFLWHHSFVFLKWMYSAVHDVHAGALCHNLSGVVKPGDALLIVGPSGCGKSSILRAIAGLWRQGHGSVRVASRESCAFLPQQPYLPLGDTLRDQLLFPQSNGMQGDRVQTSVLIDALAAVGLSNVLERCVAAFGTRLYCIGQARLMAQEISAKHL